VADSSRARIFIFNDWIVDITCSGGFFSAANIHIQPIASGTTRGGVYARQLDFMDIFAEIVFEQKTGFL